MPLWLITAALALAAAPEDTARIEQAMQRSNETIARLEKEGLKWTARHQVGSSWLEVDIERYPTTKRFRIDVVSGKRSTPITSVVESDGFWYVNQGGQPRRYRAYEAPMPIPTAVLFYARSSLIPCSRAIANPDEILSVETVDDRLVARKRITAAQRQTFEAMLKSLESLEAEIQAKGGKVPAQTKIQLENVKQWMTKGLPVTIDRETGIVLDLGQAPREIQYRNIKWKSTDRAPWVIDDKEWEDHSTPWTADHLKDVIQIGHNPAFEPGMPAGDTDVMLLNVVTGDVKRLPYPYGLASSGAFSPDRTKAYVAGTAVGEPALMLFEVDLHSGETKPLGDDSLRKGMWFGPMVSPDGSQLAAVEMLQGVGLKFQPYVIDLATSKSRQIGKPLDIKPFAWSPDGDSLYCELREPDPKSDFAKSFLCELSLDGKISKIRPGKMAVLLPKSRRFLFESDDQRTWQTCDLDGQHAKPVGDGLRSFSFPAPSADDRLVMMKFEKGQTPRPHLVDLETGEATPIKVAPGLWALPRWQ